MGGCTAVKCSNTRRKGFRLFRFPRDPKRRKTWLQNCRRDKWQPTDYSELCEIHFEEGQFEQHRQDGLKKLKPNAIPTLFDIPNPPRLLETKRKSLYKTIGNCSNDNSKINTCLTEKRLSQAILMESNVTISENYSEPVSEQCLLLDPKEELKQTRAEIKRLKDENQLMKKEIQEIEKIKEEKKLAELEVAHLKAEVQKIECEQSSSEMTMKVSDQTVECEKSSSEMTMNVAEQTVECEQSSSEMTMNVSVQRKNNSNFVNTRLHYLMLAVECELSRLETKINMSDQTVEYEQSCSEMTMNVSNQTVEREQSSSEMKINVSVQSRGVISTF